MNHHGVGISMVTDVGAMFVDPGVEATSSFTIVCHIATAAGYAVYCTVGVAFLLFLFSY